MDKSVKILCVCQSGNVRSVGTRNRLERRRFYNVIAIGAKNTGQETLNFLANWADKILLAEPKFADAFSAYKDKIEPNFTIGPDVFGRRNHPELQQIIKQQLNGLGLR